MPVLELAQALIARPSLTPDDAGCQKMLADRLRAAGFACEHLRFGAVDNLWARHGTAAPLLVFAGHTDVVPPGPRDQWRNEPFAPVVRDGLLYGRGAADMKGSLAAMVLACEQFVAAHPEHAGSIGLLITSDEEGPADDGTRRVLETLAGRDENIDYCLVGEPSCAEQLGDTVRRGRRGSLSATLTVKGVQGHVAYPEKADNAIHRALPALQELANTRWDDGHPDFPATSLQISNINAGTGASNVIPGTARIHFNFRYSPAVSAEHLQTRVRDLLDRHAFDYSLEWKDSGKPFYTADGAWLDTVCAAVQAVTGLTPERSTGGGTSDGRFIVLAGAQVVEFGPLNTTIHKVNECVAIADLEQLVEVYRRILEKQLIM